MNKRRIIVSKINSIGSVRKTAVFTKKDDQISDNSLNRIYCSIGHDNLTTYVRKEVWVRDHYEYPPYVECNYVI